MPRAPAASDFKASYYHSMLAKIIPQEELSLLKRPRAADESAMVDALWNPVREQAHEAGLIDLSSERDEEEEVPAHNRAAYHRAPAGAPRAFWTASQLRHVGFGGHQALALP
jgi:hypothetical protein